ncbi:MAG: hypothetical protein ABIW48_01585 [Burkholderiales bacterium]
MFKLTEYAEMAAAEFVEETGSFDLDARWVAEFFQDSGAQDDFPRQDVVAFFNMVQKVLTQNAQRSGKLAHVQLEKIIRLVKLARKS